MRVQGDLTCAEARLGTTWSRCQGPSQGCGRRRGTGRVADERGDDAVQLGSIVSPCRRRRARREGRRTSLESREDEKA